MLLALWLAATALRAEPLPQPLTLAQALALAADTHPDIRARLAGRDAARAERDAVAASTAFEARLLADGRWVQPSTGGSGDLGGSGSELTSRNDSRVHLILSRQLYDFGRSAAETAAAEARSEAEDFRVEAARSAHRLRVMRDFFDVLLADLAFAEADEAMAIEFVRLERIENRNRLGQASDVALADQRFRYQQQRLRRYRAEARQRTSRARLAETLDRPGELPADLVAPQLADVDAELPELDAWMERALRDNPRLRALRAEAEAAREQLRAARYAGRPVLRGELRASDWAREFSTREKYRAGLVLDMPLYTGGRTDALRARARAKLDEVEARLAARQSEIRQALREARERIGVLRAQRDQAQSELELRDLSLDRARTLYEMEAVADLGNAMSDFSGARLRKAQAEYQLVLTRGEIALLLGDTDWNPLRQRP